MPTLRAVVFDLDGTFIDSTPAILESFDYAFDKLGLPKPHEDRILASIGHILEDTFAQFTDRDPHECARVYREHYARIACDKTTLLPGALEAVQRLDAAGLRIGFATSKKREYAELILDHLGALHYFASRIGPYDVSAPKPHPDCLVQSARNLAVDLGELLLVGDTRFDVEAAKAAGVPCLCVTTGYESRASLEALRPDLIVDTLDEVTDHILARRL